MVIPYEYTRTVCTIRVRYEIRVRYTTEPYIVSQLYITKQLEYVTKDHLATHTILFKLKTALFFSFLVV